MDTIETLIGIVRSQQEKGLKKYGMTVDDANLTTVQWIDHICEEKVDELIYLQKLKQSLIAGTIVERRELLKGFASKFNDRLDMGAGGAIIDWMIDEYIEAL